MKRLYWLLTVGSIVGLSGQVNAITIDFESIPGSMPMEGLAISNQFEATAGVTFSLSDGTSPVLADVGGARTAFQGPGNGNDNVVAGEDVGNFFLTDDGLTSGTATPTLIVSYSTATQNVSGEILDIDFNESFVITAFDALTGGSVLETVTINAGDADTGNGVATNWSISRASADILRLEFAGTRSGFGFFGLGFDNFNSGVDTSGTTVVPLPAAGVLLLSGIAGLFVLRRRRS
ncbi:MAG: VPLPA-CTERM sorting domain-containing protein [Pseudomonadota bacterium]